MLKISIRLLQKPLRQIRKIFILLIGSTVVLVGIIMLVTPGPAFVVIPAGLGILALEFAWARRILKKAKAMFFQVGNGRPSSNGRPGAVKPAGKPAPGLSISRDEINTLPLFKYDGPIHLIQTDEQARDAVRELRRERVLGFDIESRPSFRKGESHPPALLQLAGSGAVYVFQLLKLQDVSWFRDLFSDPAVIKAGVGLDHDIRKLKARQEFETAGFVELSALSDAAGIRNNGLRGLAAILLGFRVSKGAQRSNWSRPDLSREQIVYAATDAFVSRELYLQLTRNQSKEIST